MLLLPLKLHQVLNQGGVGVFESPTGTGKSLSLICGSLSWLTEKRQTGDLIMFNDKYSDDIDKENSFLNTAHQEIETEDDDDEPAWAKEFENEKKEKERNMILKDLLNIRKEFDMKIQNERLKMSRIKEMRETKKQKRYHSKPSSLIKRDNEDEFLLEDAGKVTTRIDNLLKEIEMENKPKESILKPLVKEAKIIYSSRTHSQISQFVKEIRKTKYAENTRIVSLGSRKQLCIHEKVQKNHNVTTMNDVCLDMQKGPKEDRCPYLTSEEEKNESFKLGVFTDIHDIEDIALIGSEKSVCPYYGLRKTTEEADIITLPYNLLFSKSAREALQLDIHGHIVIIDEAHNVMDTINDLHSASFSLSQMRDTYRQITLYLTKYEKRLSTNNINFLKQLLYFLSSCGNYLKKCRDNNQFGTLKSMNDLLHTINVDNLNLFHLQKYLKESKLNQKLHGFTEHQEAIRLTRLQQQERKFDKVSQHRLNGSKKQSEPVENNLGSKVYIQQLEKFLSCLTNPDVDGKLYIENRDTDIHLSFMLLNPASIFEDIISVSRAIILAGGTMEPVSELRQQLFPNLSEGKFHRFSCGHIVPPSSMNVISLSSGPSRKLQFTFHQRNDIELIKELGMITRNFCNLIPGGVILFFPSYAYLEYVYDLWEKQGILEQLKKKKSLFLEPKASNQVEQTLQSYGHCVNENKANNQSGKKNGAMILCVVGGKLSEGINFSDDLGRGVLVIGLPFPNLYSAEIQEKIKYYDEKFQEKNAGNEFYENLCMKAVNQSIGRAIRHKNDYACIILLDERYHNTRISEKLPGWIKNSQIQNISKFGEAVQSIVQVESKMKYIAYFVFI